MTITRFAPSPTGSLHIGGVRTALYAYALAKHYKGKFILRIEDTDRSRLVEQAEKEIITMLSKYELNFDEKYKQSERKEIYHKYAEKLIKSGNAYYCFATKEEIQEAREIAEKNKEVFRFRSPYRELSRNEAIKKIESGEDYVIRLKTPINEEVYFEDGLQGIMKFNTNEVDDTVLLKSDGFPTYHLAVVVDDYLMKVTHVLRGAEWIPSIPKHVLLYKAFGWKQPQFFHLPLILDPEGGKLSKRKGAVSAGEFLAQGYLPEAVLNFLMLLGWSSPLERKFGEAEREIFSLQEFVEIFDTKDLNKSSGVFNREKLLWFNHQYIKNLDSGELLKRYIDWSKEYLKDGFLEKLIASKGEDYLLKILELTKDRYKLLSEITEIIYIFYQNSPKADFTKFKQTKNLTENDINIILTSFSDELTKKAEDLLDWEHESWDKFMRAIAEKLELGAGKVFMTLRVALTNSATTPPLYDILVILGKREILTRLAKYVDNK